MEEFNWHSIPEDLGEAKGISQDPELGNVWTDSPGPQIGESNADSEVNQDPGV